MGIHEYLCPSCKCIQRVKAQAGEIVRVKECQACKESGAPKEAGEAEEDFTEDELAELELLEELSGENGGKKGKRAR